MHLRELGKMIDVKGISEEKKTTKIHVDSPGTM